MKIVPGNEAIRYLLAISRYNNDPRGRYIVEMMAFNMSSSALQMMYDEPYDRWPNQSRVCTLLDERFSALIDPRWYALVLDEGGIDFLELFINGKDVSKIKNKVFSDLPDRETFIKEIKLRESGFVFDNYKKKRR